MGLTPPNRLEHLVRFYHLLDRLSDQSGGPRTLSECSGRDDWPMRGVYFFFEPTELRSHSGIGLRVVRVGTHALTNTSKTSLWARLSQHRGPSESGGGNHRGSIFRLLIGRAMILRDGLNYPKWGKGNNASREIRNSEVSLEQRVSAYIGAMPLLCLNINDPAGPRSHRGTIERNSIALLSNFEKSVLDPPAKSWLGKFSDRPKVQASGLWNNRHVDEQYEPHFLTLFESLLDS